MARGPIRSGGEGVVQGLLLLGRFRADGFKRFEATGQAFLSSLAPWVAFLLVGGVLGGLQGKPVDALTDVAVLLCWLLVPPVVSQLIALAFNRGDRWLRYATATTWCEWLMLGIYAAALLLADLAMGAGLPQHAAPLVLFGVMGAYWLALHVFLARTGLELSFVRAVALVAAVLGADALLFALGRALGGPAARVFGL